jgi:hypothetical protein
LVQEEQQELQFRRIVPLEAVEALEIHQVFLFIQLGFKTLVAVLVVPSLRLRQEQTLEVIQLQDLHSQHWPTLAVAEQPEQALLALRLLLHLCKHLAVAVALVH